MKEESFVIRLYLRPSASSADNSFLVSLVSWWFIPRSEQIGGGSHAHECGASDRARDRAGVDRVSADQQLGAPDPGAVCVRLAGPRAAVRRGAAPGDAGSAPPLLLGRLDAVGPGRL